MKGEFIEQYEHTWGVFERIVAAFDEEVWAHPRCGTATPARIAFHILQGVKYYLEDSTSIHFPSGKSFEHNCWSVAEERLPSQRDVLECASILRGKTKMWLAEMDFEAENTSFSWAGTTKLGVVLFLLRHSVYHIGELGALLSESKKGEVEDHYVKAL